MFDVCTTDDTSKFYSLKKNVISFSVAVKNPIRVDPLVFLL